MGLEKYQKISQRDYDAVAGPDWPSFDQFQLHQSVDDFVYQEIDKMLTGPTEFKNTTFCVLPFFGLELPSRSPCCLLPEDYNLDQIKADMLVGRRSGACKKCWNLEDHGVKSDRQIRNETLDFHFDKDLGGLFEMAQQGTSCTVHYEIDSSNVCNSTCVTCDSSASSLWGDLLRRNGQPAKKNWTIKTETFLPDIDFSRARFIGFRGGEPLLSTTNFEILQRLIDHNNTDCFINFTTNGSVKLTVAQKEILGKFSHVNMCFSIDGIGPVFEYLRYPSKWNTILDNIDYCRQHNITISASYTVSNLNVLYHDQTCAWFRDNQIRFIINPVYHPTYFRPGALPQTVKNQILSNQHSLDLAGFLGQHSSKDELDYKQFCQQIHLQDTWKNIQLQDYLPELANLLG
jgi:hypothetical protein